VLAAALGQVPPNRSLSLAQESSMLGVRVVTNIKSIVATAFVCLATAPSARADIKVDVSKLTCKDMLLDSITLPDNIAYWLSGYYNGKRGNTVFDLTDLQEYVNKVEQYCSQHQDATVMKAAQTILGVSK
jgi:hypothetical protein